MIKFLEHKKIDKRKWDDCIHRSPNGLVVASSWFLDVVSPGWNALADDGYETVFPLTWRKKYGFNYLYQPSFTQQLGVFSKKRNVSDKTAGDYLDSIPDEYRFVEIQVNAKNTPVKGDFSCSERITHHLDLDQSYEKIFASYSENLKRNIRRAYKNRIELSSEIGAEDIIRLFKQNKGKEVSSLGVTDYRTLLQLIREGAKRQLITMTGVRTAQGKLCAGTVFLKSNHEYIFFFSAANEEARKTGAMSLLIDYFVRAHAGEKMNLDFEGSMNKNLARFYKSFGSKEVVYLQIKRNTLPAYIRWIKK